MSFWKNAFEKQVKKKIEPYCIHTMKISMFIITSIQNRVLSYQLTDFYCNRLDLILGLSLNVQSENVLSSTCS